MTLSLRSVFILVAVILFVISAFGFDANINLVAIGLAFFAGSFIVGDRGLTNRM